MTAPVMDPAEQAAVHDAALGGLTYAQFSALPLRMRRISARLVWFTVPSISTVAAVLSISEQRARRLLGRRILQAANLR